ncbi:MAG: M28 family peptidase [Bacteroidales bacterium]|nr:M28 family peptidase [Bacteroidales bacterium]
MKKAVAILITAFSIALHIPVAAQTEKYEEIASESLQREIIEHLCDSVMEGRGSGTGGGMLARNYILNRFEQLDLKPFYFRRQESFFYNEKITMHNVMGVVPALGISDKYIVVSAHYDHLGVIKGKTYPGADDNASGVAALLTMAQMFSQMRQDGMGPSVNILFVAFDGKEYSMAGSKRFIAGLPIAPQDIVCEINMDILGSTLVPVHKNPEYLIVLGRNTLPEGMRNIISNCNYGRKLYLDIDFTFYGSDDFTRTMYRHGDHYAFNQKGVSALFFTSGFHEHTLKTTDTPAIIDYEVLAKRTKLIFYTILGISNVSNH